MEGKWLEDPWSEESSNDDIHNDFKVQSTYKIINSNLKLKTHNDIIRENQSLMWVKMYHYNI